MVFIKCFKLFENKQTVVFIIPRLCSYVCVKYFKLSLKIKNLVDVY